MSIPFSFRVLGSQTWDIDDDNVDIEIEVNGMVRYSATFVTPQNITSLFAKNRLTGECAAGTYLWAANMIIVQDLQMETIRQTIEDLLRSGELGSACHQIVPSQIV